MNRYALLTDANTFPFLGAGASLKGCVNDNRFFINNIMQGPWKKSGYTKAYLLSERLNEAERVRECLAELVGLAIAGDTIVFANSSHGTHFTDWKTGVKCSCTVAHTSDWGKPKSFVSKLDYQRAFANLKPGVNVWCFFDSCESGNIGQAFKLLEKPDRVNRWLEPPMENASWLAAKDLEKIVLPQQVCTMAGCHENGTCADIQSGVPHGAFSGARDDTLLRTQHLSWYQLGKAIDSRFAAEQEEQRVVVNGPDRAFDLA